MADWDAFVACVDGKDAEVGQFLRNEGLNAFSGGKEMAMAGVNAIIGFWNGLNPAVRWGLKFAGKKLSDAARKRLATLIVEAGGVVEAGFALADLAIDLALFIGVLVASFEIGVLVTASAECLVAA
jgi:hypothetical protein